MATTLPSEKPVSRSREEITALIEQWRKSGKYKKTFCLENNISYMTFIGWTNPKKSRKLSGAKENFPGFIPLRVNKTTPELFAELSLRSGSRIIFNTPVSAQYLRAILR